MALYENRVKKTGLYFKNFSSFFAFTYRSFSPFILIIISIWLLYIAPINSLSNITLELNGKIIELSTKTYDIVLSPIKFLSDKINLLDNIEKQNAELKKKLIRLEIIENQYVLLEAENKSLKHLLNIIPDTEYNVKRVRLLSISLNPFSKTILIGAGTNNNVSIDQIIASEGGLIGRVIKVSNNYAQVLLINDINSRVPVITSISGERAIISGENNKLTLLYLQDHSKIREGEIILTSGDGKIYPYGLPVGRIVNIQENKLIIEPIVNLNRIDFVDIISQ